MGCRICGNQKTQTKDCCPTPLETGLAIPQDEFEKLMYEVWSKDITEQIGDHKIPDFIVSSFYNDWINGEPIDARTYLIQC